MKLKVESNPEKMEICDKSHFHIFNIALTCPLIILLPFIGEKSGRHFEHGVSIALQSFIGLSGRGDPTGRGGPVEILWQDVISGELHLLLGFRLRNHFILTFDVVVQEARPIVIFAGEYHIVEIIMLWHLPRQWAPLAREELVVDIFEVASPLKVIKYQR